MNKHYHITENDFKNKDYCLDKFNSKDTFIGDIAHTEKELISLIEDNIKNPKIWSIKIYQAYSIIQIIIITNVSITVF